MKHGNVCFGLKSLCLSDAFLLYEIIIVNGMEHERQGEEEEQDLEEDEELERIPEQFTEQDRERGELTNANNRQR